MPSEEADQPERELKYLQLEAARLDTANKSLEFRLKQLQIRNTPTFWKATLTSTLTSPVLITAIVTAGITWVTAIRTEAQTAAERDATLILEAIKTGDPGRAAENLQFLVDAGLISNDIGRRLTRYLETRAPGTGPKLPSLQNGTPAPAN